MEWLDNTTPFLKSTLDLPHMDMAIRLFLTFLFSTSAAIGYAFIQRTERITIKNLPYTMILLSMIVSGMMMTVGNSVAHAFGLLGAISILRFRLNVKNPTDMAAVLFTITIGLACGIGMMGLAAIFTVLVLSIFLVLDKVNRFQFLCRRDLLIASPKISLIHDFMAEMTEKFGTNHSFNRPEEFGKTKVWNVSVRFPSSECLAQWKEWLEADKTLIFSPNQLHVAIDLSEWKQMKVEKLTAEKLINGDSSFAMLPSTGARN